ncbi:ZIP zinc/iron transport family [Microthyrium microscopicum]|uniref:ZIP zinc/iron transport family n=1 Tax=Microthyrium microscopicum TaxID=703497 RepID=A0A6A6U0A7_9PEZI|nr:ZIP zinc/iron transport family [Microthyrium microscopicum]
MDVNSIAHLVLRDSGADAIPSPGHCDTGNAFNGHIGARISSIFVILVGSLVGAVFPVYAKRHITKNKYMEYGFFFAKYFGSGVIIATAFIHLLAPAAEALSNPCLTGPITSYSWPFGICLMMIFILFFVELMTVRYASFGHSHDHDEESHIDGHERDCADADPTFIRGEDHLGHGREHMDHDDTDTHSHAHSHSHSHSDPAESYSSQLAAIFILEFGVVFHSIFIGLTLAVAGEEFTSLYVVLVFHQTFEGLGLGTRLASAPWPRNKLWTPYAMALGYGLSTPVAIAIGLIVRNTYPPGSQTTLIVNGIFDSLSAGILIYTGLVELMAHEFMFSPSMRKAPIKVVLTAFVQMCLGAGLMAVLGKWA